MIRRDSYRAMYNAAGEMMSCRHITDLAKLLETPRHKLSLYALSPRYSTFSLPKSDGSKRIIEAPEPQLMSLLKKVNYYLQCTYYFVMPRAAYGYIATPRNEKQPRNIVTHAKRHIDCVYLINADFEDFFHQINDHRVFTIFFNPPFNLGKKAAELLSRLCTWLGRLPMGSPTSPVLSNFATITLDESLTECAKNKNITYTRYVDNLTFSSQQPFHNSFFDHVKLICDDFGFVFNEKKTILFDHTDTKIVTGLEVSSRVEIPEALFYELSQDMKRLRRVMEANYLMEGARVAPLAKKMQQQVEGKLNFLQMVYGKNNKKHLKYQEEYEEALSPKISSQSLRWTHVPYFSE